MTIIPLDFSIERDPETNKKLYRQLHTHRLQKATPPKGWQNLQSHVTPEQAHSYAIRCDDDLVVIDCDSIASTKLIDSVLQEPRAYIVISDKGEKHYYFKPTEYYRNSKLYKQTRVRLNEIDILHGKALVFTPNPHNTTKEIYQGDISYLTPIPNEIIDLLTTQLTTQLLARDEDYKPVPSFIAPIAEQALALYTHHTKGRNPADMFPLLHLITPAQYRQELSPDNNPARLEHGRMTYLHAISFKISSDPSISFELHKEIITTVSSMLQRPMDPERLRREIFDYVKRELNYTRWQYSPTATNKPLVSINGGEYCPIYRTLEDEYILCKPSGAIEKVTSTQKFKLVIASKNYSLMINNKKMPLDTNITLKKMQEAMKTLTLTNLPYHPTGVYTEDGSLYYNQYIPTKYLGIIRGEYKQDHKYQGPESHPTITALIKNVMYDHSTHMYDKFMQFLAHKLKTLKYSPLVFQLMGNRGTGKSQLMSLFKKLTDLQDTVSFSIKTEFNGNIDGKLFLTEDEGLVTQYLINKVKELSGSPLLSVRKLYQERSQVRNIATYFFTTNKTTPMAETIDDRRFVTFSSFKAPKFYRKDLDTAIALELEAFALALRETPLPNPKLYIDANEWHDEIHYQNFEEQQTQTQHIPSKVANMMHTLNTLTGKELHAILTECFGQGYHCIYTQKAPLTIAIPLAKYPTLIRASDNSQLTHNISRVELKQVEVDEHIKRNTNKLNTYGQPYHFLRLQLSPSQKEEWHAAYNKVEELDV